MSKTVDDYITVDRLIDYRLKREVELGVRVGSLKDMKMMRNRMHQREHRIRKQDKQQQ